MQYQSTRDTRVSASPAQAIAEGICPDGGLFVPKSFPHLSSEELAALIPIGYRARAEKIMAPFLSGFSAEELAACISGAYADGRFSTRNPAPVITLKSGVSFLELWHGPTCAFKDMALQLLPRLLTLSLKKTGTAKDALILVATSGDTGKAALEGFRDVPGTRILVFYPQNGVSAMQERQMRTQEGSNVFVAAVRGNFDDAQTGVKRLFTDPELCREIGEEGCLLSSANSINWGRLLPQIVYYFSAWCDLVSAGLAGPGEPVNFCVPTGNFGDILAAYYAKKMGLPVGRLICASNANNVLTEFLETGIYDRNRKFYQTISPSMDILVSSNLERLLFDLTGGDSERVVGWMKELSENGCYNVGAEILAKLRSVFSAGFCGDGETKEEIARVWREERYLCDPHTAVASRVFRDYVHRTGDSARTVIVSTASPYKFAPDVLSAAAPDETAEDAFEAAAQLSRLTGTPVPEPIAALRTKPIRFSRVCGTENMKSAVLDAARKG